MNIIRSIFNNLRDDLAKPEILILLGARQVGKSTLMQELMGVARKQKREFISFNLEFPEDLLYFSKSDQELFKSLTRVENALIFIDEFHYLKNASKLFKAIYDTKKNIKIIASGSSSLEIHKHLKESLAGRRKVTYIYPFTWEEHSQSDKPFSDFIIFGGMPGLTHIANKNDQIEYLSQLVQAYILKDIKSLIKEENIRVFNHLLFFLAENQGQLIPTSNLSREIGLTNKTIEKHLSILEQTFVVYGLHSYSKKLSNELKKSKKYYFYDNGIRNSLIKNFSNLKQRDDLGTLYESYVFLELHKRLDANIELRFWRTKQGDEVDFLWIKNQTPIPIEVKTHFSSKKPPKGLIKFLKTYEKCPYGIIFTNENSADIECNGYLIKVRSFQEVHEVLDDL